MVNSHEIESPYEQELVQLTDKFTERQKEVRERERGKYRDNAAAIGDTVNPDNISSDRSYLKVRYLPSLSGT